MHNTKINKWITSSKYLLNPNFTANSRKFELSLVFPKGRLFYRFQVSGSVTKWLVLLFSKVTTGKKAQVVKVTWTTVNTLHGSCTLSIMFYCNVEADYIHNEESQQGIYKTCPPILWYIYLYGAQQIFQNKQTSTVANTCDLRIK